MRNNYLRLVRKDTWQLLKSSSVGVIFAVLFTALAVMSLTFIEGSVQVDREKAENLSALSLIEVTAYTPNARLTLDDQNLTVIQQTPGVAGVYPWYQESLSLEDSTTWPSVDNPGEIPATPWIPELAPKVVAGEVPQAGPGQGEIVLPHSIAGGTTDSLVGHDIQVALQKEVAPGQGELVNLPMRVIATADNSVVGAAGTQPSYVSYETLKTLSSSSNQKNYSLVYVKAEDSSQVLSVQNSLGQQGFGVTSLSEKMPTLYGLLKAMQYFSYLLLGLATAMVLMLGFLVGAAWIRFKTKELALLKMLGYSSKDLFVIVIGQLGIFGLLLALLTTATSWVGSWALSTYMASQGENFLGLTHGVVPSWSLTLLVFLLYPLALVLAGSLPASKIARLDMDQVFRDL